MMDALIFRLKFRQLLLLQQISLEPSLNRAARSLNLSQPTASKLLQDMEDDLGAQLFERHSHGLTPTDAGRVAIRHAEKILADLGRLREDLQAVKRGLTGTVSIGAIGAALHEIVTPVLASTTRSHPEISLTLRVTTSDDLMALLQSGRIDIALGRPIEGIGHDLLTIEEISDEPLLVVAGCDNILFQAEALDLNALIHQRWIVQMQPSPLRRAFEGIFTIARLPMPQRLTELSSVLATIDLLTQSDMVSVLPCSLFRMFEKTGMIGELPVSLPDIIGPYHLIRMRDRALSPAAQFVWDALRERAIGKADSGIG
ncbi:MULTISPECIES: LysR family transcriptional regulator [Asaia]|uniref:LysR family transcriptional regulator n=1 Tax=Asaia TaxID=91914 RepID=UPI002552E330|nr:LysR substrate-binding domain-containing protein [Asaia sp. HumB]MDL2172379.1 LysR substrate-binding domain-containing protein [Asaia sp. HumB]